MTDNKKNIAHEIEDTLACSAFAEAGEPCPICSNKDDREEHATLEKNEPGRQSLEENFACAAFHEQNLECPIGTDKKK